MILGEGSCISCDLATHMMIWPTWSKSMREINQDWTRDISTLLLKFWSNFCSIATRQWPECWNLYIDFKIAFQVRRVHRCGQCWNQNFDLKKVKIKTWKLNFKFQVRRGDGYIDVGGVYDSPAAQAYWATRLVHQHFSTLKLQPSLFPCCSCWLSFQVWGWLFHRSQGTAGHYLSSAKIWSSSLPSSFTTFA